VGCRRGRYICIPNAWSRVDIMPEDGMQQQCGRVWPRVCWWRIEIRHPEYADLSLPKLSELSIEIIASDYWVAVTQEKTPRFPSLRSAIWTEATITSLFQPTLDTRTSRANGWSIFRSCGPSASHLLLIRRTFFTYNETIGDIWNHVGLIIPPGNFFTDCIGCVLGLKRYFFRKVAVRNFQ